MKKEIAEVVGATNIEKKRCDKKIIQQLALFVKLCIF